MPVKGPQYDVQHRVMEEEYTFGGGYNGSPQGQSKTPPNAKVYQQSQDSNGADYHRSSDQQRLPPGAMQPLEQSWSSPNPKPVSPPPSSTGNSNPRRSRSPPQPNQGYNSFDSGIVVAAVAYPEGHYQLRLHPRPRLRHLTGRYGKGIVRTLVFLLPSALSGIPAKMKMYLLRSGNGSRDDDDRRFHGRQTISQTDMFGLAYC